MDFEDANNVVISESNIGLASEHDDIPMEFENIQEQPILMETENEEIIGKDISIFLKSDAISKSFNILYVKYNFC